MLRSTLRNRGSKDPKDEINSSPSHSCPNLVLGRVSLSDFEDSESNIFEDANDGSIEIFKEKESQRDHNKNLMKNTSNSSLDNQFDNDDHNNFPYSEREIYETQLAQLQEQLVAIMIQDQDKSEKLKKYEELDIEKLSRDFQAEQDKNFELTEQIKALKDKSQNQKVTRSNQRRKGNHRSKGLDADKNDSEEWVDLCGDMSSVDKKPEPENSVPVNTVTPPSSISSKQQKPPPAEILSTPISKEEAGGARKSIFKRERFLEYKKKIIELIVDRLWDFVNEEPKTRTEDTDDENGDPLAVKTLRENINRFTNGIKPITSFMKSAAGIVSWSNPAATFIAFVVYMYAARHGYLFSLLLLMIIWKLFLNYLHARGIALPLGNKEKDEAPSDDKSWSDKFQLVLQVARRVQNLLGKMADSLEKIKNLLTWQHPATKTLFIYVCILFVASILLNGQTLFAIIALGFGIKLFITRPLYVKFPKVKQRYDGTSRIWMELPTDDDLLTKEVIQSECLLGSPNVHSPATALVSSPISDQNVSQQWANFCERLKIPFSESPLPIWEEGRRCSLMDKDKPLTHMKNGRLYLTQNFLCFERNKAGSPQNLAINLSNISHVSKSKPIGIMPGTGMAIEVCVKGVEKVYRLVIFKCPISEDEKKCFLTSLPVAGQSPIFDIKYRNWKPIRVVFVPMRQASNFFIFFLKALYFWSITWTRRAVWKSSYDRTCCRFGMG